MEEEEEKEVKKIEIKRRRNKRYFDEEKKVRSLAKNNVCFKCHEKGHLARHCSEKFFSCLYCLGNHDESECDEEVNTIYE